MSPVRDRFEITMEINDQSFGITGLTKVKLVTYKTPSSIVDSYRATANPSARIRIAQTDGTYKGYNRKELLRNIQSRGSWAFVRRVRGLPEVHIWYSKKASPKRIASDIAHEAGHLVSPRYRDPIKEQRKAMKYEIVTVFALDAMRVALENNPWRTKDG